MRQAPTMSLHEKLAIGVKAIELKKQGNPEEAEKMKRQIPPCHPTWQSGLKNVWAPIFS
jgi:hypothetical protein